MKGAALANLGDIPVGFFPEPLALSNEGVKLGESTLKPLLELLLYRDSSASEWSTDRADRGTYFSIV